MTNPTDEWLEKALADHKAKKKAEKAARPAGQKCSTCAHFVLHPFSPKYHYCANGRSKFTGNGLAKTTPTKWCQNWKEPTPPTP
jgi:hypothetical protein